MGLLDAVKAELERLEAVDGFEGQLALRLAEQIDTPRAGMAVAQDSKELRAVMADIRGAMPAEEDSVDDSRSEADRILRSVG